VILVNLEEKILSRSSENFEARLSVHGFIQKFLQGYTKNAIKPMTPKFEHKIWVYWGQGKNSMLPIVMACLYQLYMCHDAQNVVFLDDDNISDYITIPDYIYTKLHSNKTHFSDVLRVALLAEHGGAWIDLTCYCSGSILPLYEKALETGFFAYSGTEGQEFLLSSWFMASRPNEVIPTLLRDALYYYWQEKNELEYYFLIHYIFEALYNLDTEFSASWDSRYFLDRNVPHTLQGKLFNQFDIAEWNDIMSLSLVHKLTYKYSIQKRKGTYLSYILNLDNRLEEEKYNGKVKLKFAFYSGEDQYSDGDIEDEMLDIAKDNYDGSRNLEEILENDNRWPILYHFSPIRENVLNWYPFTEGASILEVGSGCGAITGALCRSGTSVTCIELSKKRALVSAYRHKSKENLEIYVGNMNDIVFSSKFEYITLIGVLEYAKLYTHTQNPFVDFLKKIKALLAPNGKLITAIENRYGLKYWAGAKEDHTGLLFEGLLGYKNSNSATTFSKNELIKILQEAGFPENEFYYPYPDYKMPHAVYSDRRLPQAYELNLNNLNYDQDKISLFDEQVAYEGIIENGLYDFFSNSFLVISK